MSEPPLLDVRNLSVRFAMGSGWRTKRHLKAVDDVSFQVRKGQTLGIVGESGSGKTTAALAVARLIPAFAGQAFLGDSDILTKQGEDLRRMRRRIQVIFQDPYSSLNPRKRVADIVREPLDSLTDMSAREKSAVVDEMFEAVGLRADQQRLFPHQFSGGQRQRIGIARALSTRPDLIICDEAVSALDVAVQAQILNLLMRLQTHFGLAYLFISHDLGVVQHMSDDIVVMYMGKVFEQADRLSLFNSPQHPYTQALLSAVPRLDHPGQAPPGRSLLGNDPPDAANLPEGCRFASRCPKMFDRCRSAEPAPIRLKDTHSSACHLAAEPFSI